MASLWAGGRHRPYKIPLQGGPSLMVALAKTCPREESLPNSARREQSLLRTRPREESLNSATQIIDCVTQINNFHWRKTIFFLPLWSLFSEPTKLRSPLVSTSYLKQALDYLKQGLVVTACKSKTGKERNSVVFDSPSIATLMESSRQDLIINILVNRFTYKNMYILKKRKENTL